MTATSGFFVGETTYTGEGRVLCEHSTNKNAPYEKLLVTLSASGERGGVHELLISFAIQGGFPGDERDDLVPRGLDILWHAREDDRILHLQREVIGPVRVQTSLGPLHQSMRFRGTQMTMPVLVSGPDLRHLSFDVTAYFVGPERAAGGSNYAWHFKCVFDLDAVPSYGAIDSRTVTRVLRELAAEMPCVENEFFRDTGQVSPVDFPATLF